MSHVTLKNKHSGRCNMRLIPYNIVPQRQSGAESASFEPCACWMPLIARHKIKSRPVQQIFTFSYELPPRLEATRTTSVVADTDEWGSEGAHVGFVTHTRWFFFYLHHTRTTIRHTSHFSSYTFFITVWHDCKLNIFWFLDIGSDETRHLKLPPCV